MYHFNCFLDDRHGEALQQVRQLTGMSMSEFARRLFDVGLRPSVLNEVIPLLSGRLEACLRSG